MPASSLRFRFARGLAWSFAGAAICQGLSLVASIIAARMLGRVAFGELGIVLSTVGMFGVLAGFGLGTTTTKHVAEFRDTDRERAGKIIGMSSVVSFGTAAAIAGLLFFTSSHLASYTLNAPHLVKELQIACGLLFFNAIAGAQTGTLAGLEAFRTIAQVNLLRGFVSFPLIVGGVYFWGLLGAVLGHAATACLGALFNHIALRIKVQEAAIPVRYRGVGSELPVLWRFSLPAVLIGVVVSPVTWVANTMLVNRPNGYAEMGLFNAANQWRMALMFIPGILGQILVPMMSHTLSSADSKSVKKTLLAAIGINGIAVILPGAVIAVFSPLVMEQYGEGFRDAWPILIACLATVCLAAPASTAGNLITASGRMWLGFFMNLGWAITFLSAVWFLVEFGALGVATAYVIAYGIHGAWVFVYVQRFLTLNQLSAGSKILFEK